MSCKAAEDVSMYSLLKLYKFYKVWRLNVVRSTLVHFIWPVVRIKIMGIIVYKRGMKSRVGSSFPVLFSSPSALMGTQRDCRSMKKSKELKTYKISLLVLNSRPGM